MTIHSALYVSSATPTLDDGDVQVILERSRRRNAERGLTGVLLFTGDSFSQVLEGSEGELERILADIARDDRHRGMKILLRRRAEEREFAGWDMGYVRIDDQRLVLPHDVQQALQRQDRSELLAFMQHYYAATCGTRRRGPGSGGAPGDG